MRARVLPIAGRPECWLMMLCLAWAPANSSADDLSDALQAVRAVQLNGEGNQAAAKAMPILCAADAERLPEILSAMDGVNSIALNWLRGAVNQVVQRSGDKLPLPALKSYFEDASHHPMGRLLAFELLTRDNAELRAKMIPKLIDDPSLPLRFMAVERLVDLAEKSSESAPAEALGNLGLALEKARDVDQVQAIAKKMDDLGVKIDLQSQLGFLNTWQLVGSFDNKDMKGFDVAYGPEADVTNVELTASYEGLDGKASSWQKATTASPTGNVDLNDLIGKVKGATVYAYTTFRAPEEAAAQFRIGTANATKIWLNGELVMSNEIYHNSNSIDKFIGDVQLKEGENQILIKVCQNEQTESWAQDWQFQFRICDESGKAISPVAPPEAQR